MKFSEKVGNWSRNKRLNFGGDPDLYTDDDTDPDRDTGKTCLGGGLHCPTASSVQKFLSGYTYRQTHTPDRLLFMDYKSDR